MDSPSPLTGKLLGGRYRVGAMLGAGGMGAVYEGVQEGLDRKVALKVLHPHLAGERELLGRFQREARLVAGLGHPNVVQISDFQTPDGEPPFLVMERLVGENLRDALKRNPQLSQARVAYIAMQVLSALDAAHRANIVHRDIKPDNIFLERTNVQADIVKVLDFGVAKLLGGEEEASNKLTRQGFVVGTLAYMAPEQASGEGVDGRSDLYALGACMYVAIAGRKPFEAPSTTALLRAMLGDAPVPLTAIRQDIDDAFWQVVARALAKKKEERFATAAEMARALTPFAKPTTMEVALSVKPGPAGAAGAASDSGPVSTQPTREQTPLARSSDPTPAPSTVPDDSGETHPPHTAPLPTRPKTPDVAPTQPVTQPMPVMDVPFERTARMSPVVAAVAMQSLTHQASPPPPVVAAAHHKTRAGLWAIIGGSAAVLLAALGLFVGSRLFAPRPPNAVAPRSSATASSTVAAATSEPTVEPLSVAATPSATTTPTATSTMAARPIGRPALGFAPSATSPIPAIAPPPPTVSNAFAAPIATASSTTPPATAPRQPIVCEIAKQLHDHGDARGAARLAAQCVAQGGSAPF